MKIEMVEAVEKPYVRFVVSAENDYESILLRHFLNHEGELQIGGWTISNCKTRSFNFGKVNARVEDAAETEP